MFIHSQTLLRFLSTTYGALPSSPIYNRPIPSDYLIAKFPEGTVQDPQKFLLFRADGPFFRK